MMIDSLEIWNDEWGENNPDGNFASFWYNFIWIRREWEMNI